MPVVTRRDIIRITRFLGRRYSILFRLFVAYWFLLVKPVKFNNSSVTSVHRTVTSVRVIDSATQTVLLQQCNERFFSDGLVG